MGMKEGGKTNSTSTSTTNSCGSKEEEEKRRACFGYIFWFPHEKLQKKNPNINDKGDFKFVDEVDQVGIGKGELYSLAHALRVDNIIISGTNTRTMGVGSDMIRKNFGAMKERLLEKLSAAAVPAEALDNARRMLESVLRDVTVAAHALSKDALQRIKSHLVDILPSLSPAFTTKIVDDAEREATGAAGDNYNDERELEASDDHQKYSASTTPILLDKRSSKL